MKNIIYKVTNTKTNESYIGVTTKSLYSRKKDQIEKSRSNRKTKFYTAIATYGADAFIWEQIDSANSINELAKREKEYILKYNSKEEGYNSDNGGGIKKTIYRYDLDGNLLDTFDCLNKASEVVNTHKKVISRVCLSKIKRFNNYYWSYDYVEKFIPKTDSRKKKVFQFSRDGEFINEFDSVSEASKLTGYNKSSIAKVCRGERKHCCNYYWEYVE